MTARLPRGFHLWTLYMQRAWLKQHKLGDPETNDLRTYSKTVCGHAVERFGDAKFKVVRYTRHDRKEIATLRSEPSAWQLCDRLREAYVAGYQNGRGKL